MITLSIIHTLLKGNTGVFMFPCRTTEELLGASGAQWNYSHLRGWAEMLGYAWMSAQMFFTDVDASKLLALPNLQIMAAHRSTCTTRSLASTRALSWSWRRINFRVSASAFCVPLFLLIDCMCNTLAKLPRRLTRHYLLMQPELQNRSQLVATVIFLICECPVCSQYAAHEWLPLEWLCSTQPKKFNGFFLLLIQKQLKYYLSFFFFLNKMLTIEKRGRQTD